MSSYTHTYTLTQIIARINTSEPRIKASIHDLLLRVGKEHPQALIYPLTVASKSASFARRTAAESILEQMESFAPQLVKQAKLVSEELIRVAILWHEMWHEALEEVCIHVFLYSCMIETYTYCLLHAEIIIPGASSHDVYRCMRFLCVNIFQKCTFSSCLVLQAQPAGDD